MASIDNIQETTMADLDRILRKDLKNHWALIYNMR